MTIAFIMVVHLGVDNRIKRNFLQHNILKNIKICGIMNKIIVSMTSWPKRIGNVATVVQSLLN